MFCHQFIGQGLKICAVQGVRMFKQDEAETRACRCLNLYFPVTSISVPHHFPAFDS